MAQRQDDIPPMRVLFLDKGFLRPRGDKPIRGVELFNIALLRDLSDLGHSVVLPAAKWWRPTLEREFASSHNIALRWLPDVPGSGISAALATASALRTRERYDLLQLGDSGRALTPAVRTLALAKRFDRCAVIGHRTPTRPFVALMERLGAHVTVVSESLAQEYRDLGARSLRISYGVARHQRFHPGERQAHPHSDQPVRFCVLGALYAPWKGASLAIEAFGLLPPDIRERCELHLKSHPSPPPTADPRIVWHEWSPSDTVPDFLRSMDAMIVPSTSLETFSQAMVQGMLTGLPVITTDLPVLAEKIDVGGGIVCPTAQDMAHAITQFAQNPDLRRSMGERARQTALERYVWDTAAYLRALAV